MSPVSARGATALTEPAVPTGMKIGVSMVPWSVWSRPARAPVSGHVAWRSKVSGTVERGSGGG